MERCESVFCAVNILEEVSGGYFRGSDLDGLMSDIIETLNLRDYGQVLHQAWVNDINHNYMDAIRAFLKVISKRGVTRVVTPPENMVLRSGRIMKRLQYRREILYFVPYGLKYSLYRSQPLLGIYIPQATVPQNSFCDYCFSDII